MAFGMVQCSFNLLKLAPAIFRVLGALLEREYPIFLESRKQRFYGARPKVARRKWCAPCVGQV